MAAPPSARPRLSRPIVWVGLAVCVSAVIVQTTRSGVDVLALLVAAFLLLLLERTLGDWIADTLGSGPAALVFAGIALAGLLYVTSGEGRASAASFFAGAQARGYRTAYFTVPEPGKGRTIKPLEVVTPTPSASGAPTARAKVPVSAPAVPPPAAGGDPVARPRAAGVRITRLRPSTNVAVVGQPITLHAELVADTDGELPPVEFSVDGRRVASVASVGTSATASWSTRVPGQYVVRARLSGSFAGGPALSAVITVLPGRVSGAAGRRFD